MCSRSACLGARSHPKCTLSTLLARMHAARQCCAVAVAHAKELHNRAQESQMRRRAVECMVVPDAECADSEDVRSGQLISSSTEAWW